MSFLSLPKNVFFFLALEISGAEIPRGISDDGWMDFFCRTCRVGVEVASLKLTWWCQGPSGISVQSLFRVSNCYPQLDSSGRKNGFYQIFFQKELANFFFHVKVVGRIQNFLNTNSRFLLSYGSFGDLRQFKWAVLKDLYSWFLCVRSYMVTVPLFILTQFQAISINLPI